MENRFWVDYCLAIYRKAKEEKLLSNTVYLRECWKWLITNKILFYCSFGEFKEAMKSPETIDEVKAILFTSFRINLPTIKEWIKINSNMLMIGRIKVNSKTFINLGNTVYSNTPKQTKKLRQLALEEEDTLLTAFEIEPLIVQKLLNKLHIDMQEKFYRNVNFINKVEPFKNDNPFNTKQKKPFEIIINYYLNIPKILHTDNYWREFEREYMSILVESLKRFEEKREMAVEVGNLVNKYEMDNFTEIAEQAEIDSIQELLWDAEDDLDFEEIDDEINEYNDLLKLAVTNKKKADKELKKYFK